jgi:HAE1 family hydrophobic/amphiphilic exporter-1
MGQAVIGGVITSSLLTLVVVPVVYCYMDDLSEFLQRLWSGKQKSIPEASVEAKM